MNRLSKPDYLALARVSVLPDGKAVLAWLQASYEEEIQMLLSPAASDATTTAKMQGRATAIKEILEQFAKAPELSR
jgi:hypothetical protein